jgi:hypothetical protein
MNGLTFAGRGLGFEIDFGGAAELVSGTTPNPTWRDFAGNSGGNGIRVGAYDVALDSAGAFEN